MHARRSASSIVVAMTLLAAGLGGSEARAFSLAVVDASGQPVAGFRWQVEEDTTLHVVPGVRSNDIPALTVHGSYSPVVAKGTSTTSSATIDVPANRRYLVSVLPLGGHTLSGAQVAVGQAQVTVVVNTEPIPTAQISVLVFHDRQPINNAPDIPAEPGLAGFSIVISDALGQVSQDAFGNPLGTTYQQNADGSFVLDPEGEPVVAQLGSGVILTDTAGEALIRFLPPGKYGIRASPPIGSDWVQTATIEGTPTVDAWVKAGEPPYFSEWGFFDHHAFIGFVRPMRFPAPPTGTVGSITGRVVYVHANRPPLQPGLHPGVPVEECWVGLNALGGADEQVYAQPCGPGGSFTIANVPPGVYQLVMWDLPLDAIIDFRTLTVPPTGGVLALGDVPIYAWFGFFEGSVFYDANANGYREPGEVGIPNQALNLRFLDGSLYKTTLTDPNGRYRFKEVFPFFHWLVAEVDYTRYKPTGMTAVIDDGGPLPPGGRSTPQPQPDINPNTGDNLSRSESGEVLTQAMLLYAGQAHRIDWGKVAYGRTENGGISGIVHYATTRAENDPRYAVGDDWEPKVPRVQVNLYADANGNSVIDDLDGDGQVTPADVDNAPFGNFPGLEDVDRNANGIFNPGDALNITHTDSWDDSRPTGCVGPPQLVHGQPVTDCAETLRTWNQVRPGVFDGGYLVASYFPGGMASGSAEVQGLPPGLYIVEAVPPPGYETVKEEDKNVDFGERPTPNLVPPVCVGEPHRVPAELSLFPGVPAPFAGTTRPLCDRKQVRMGRGQNSAADFFLFTEVPKAGRIWGMVLNDVLLEFNPDSPQKGTNFGVPWLPISIKDFQGHELVRTYSDEWGRYNALVPSTFSVNRPTPTGVSPGMLTVCLNDAGPIPDPSNPSQLIRDPWYNPAYGRICTNWEFYPGKTTPLDTPILPIAAFTANRRPLDCEFPDGTPLIYSVSGPAGGPHVPLPGGLITLTSVGAMRVPNPAYDPDTPSSPPTIIRDYGFGGTQGAVTVGGTLLPIVSWAADGSRIVARVPAGVRTGQLKVWRGNGKMSEVGITLHVGPRAVRRVAPGGSIQQAIDTAPVGALILVAPGTYKQNPILWKPVELQGWGAFSTIIEAGPLSPVEQAAWDAKLASLIASGDFELIPGERPDFYLERGAGITVGARRGLFNPGRRGGIDGFTITGAIKGGGIFVNGYAPYLTLGNNRLISNQGSFGGGIRVGTPSLVNSTSTGYLSSSNENLSIHHNHISQNGGIDGGGGVALFNGAHGYALSDNFICGNFTLQYGGGIAHFGLSDEGRIFHNRIVSNQSFDEGGGIIIAGELVPAGAPPGTLTPGAGSVRVVFNHIQGNLAGDDGGGVRTLMVNGQDVRRFPTSPTRWNQVALLNNFIVNNSSADSGGGVALDDTARVAILSNTIAHNDSTATGVDAFGGPCIPNEPPGQVCPEEGGTMGGITTSVPQVAGIAARAHSAGLRAAFGPGFEQEFSNPVLHDNIIWHNRAFYWDAAYHDGLGGLRPDVAAGEAPVYWDLAVYGTLTPQSLQPRFSVLSEPTPGEPTNVVADPGFVSGYFNVYQATSSGSAFGNFVTTTFLPTGLVGDYHLGPGSPANGVGAGLLRFLFPELLSDIDGEPRFGSTVDAGADEAP